MLHVYADRVVHSVVPIHDATEVTGYGMEMAEPFAALSVEERFEMVSRKDSPLYAAE
jgi:Icc protein